MVAVAVENTEEGMLCGECLLYPLCCCCLDWVIDGSERGESDQTSPRHVNLPSVIGHFEMRSSDTGSCIPSSLTKKES